MSVVPSPVGGLRVRWPELPAPIRGEIERILAARVVKAASQDNGFSPGMASRLWLDDGRMAFVKAIDTQRSPRTTELHRAEARISEKLPAYLPVPCMLGSYDDGEWVILAFEDVAGYHPAQPWLPEELDRVLDAMTRLAATLTPSPLDLGDAADSPRLGGWHKIAASQELVAKLQYVDHWAADNLGLLCDVESGLAEAAAGNTLLHLDIIAHNVLLTPDRVVFVDWPHARVGAEYIDLLVMAPSLAMHASDPQPIVQCHPLSRNADPEAIDAVLAARVGCLILGAIKPAPPGLPALPAFKLAQGRPALRWLASRLRSGRKLSRAGD